MVDFTYTENLKWDSLSSIARRILNEDKESPVVRNIKSVENFDELLKKSEYAGQALSQQEIDVVNRMKTKPSKLVNNEIRFGAPEETSGKNKELVIRKVTGKYVGFFSLRNPVDVSPDKGLEQPTGDATVPVESPTEPQKDEVVIIVSLPLSNSMKDVSLLSNFITHLLSEYQIS